MQWCGCRCSSDDGHAAQQALEAGGARRLRNESFFSAPQLKRDPLGSARALRYGQVPHWLRFSHRSVDSSTRLYVSWHRVRTDREQGTGPSSYVGRRSTPPVRSACDRSRSRICQSRLDRTRISAVEEYGLDDVQDIERMRSTARSQGRLEE